MEKTNKFNCHYLVAFWVTLLISIGLIVGGFFAPPTGIVDGSIMTSVGELFLWPTLALAAKTIHEGRVAKFKIGNNTIDLGEDKDGNGIDDNYEKTLKDD